MKSKGMSKRLGAMVLLLTVAGPPGPFAAADAAARPETVTRAKFETWFKEISNWGRWGKDDELGTLNLITPEKRKAAAALVRDGVSMSLSLDLNKTADALNTNPFEQTLTVGEFGGHAVAEDRYSVRYHGFAHSHMDGLTHFAHAGTLYNGVSVDVLEKGGAGKLGIQNAKDGIFTRGVLVDIPWLRGVEFLDPGTAITSEDLEAWEAKTKVTIASGDVLLIRTGVDHIYGEKELGGTSVLYLSAVPFERLGFPTYGETPFPAFTKTALHAVPPAVMAAGAQLGAAYALFRKRAQAVTDSAAASKHARNHGHVEFELLQGKLLTPFNWVLLLLMAFCGVSMIARFALGLGGSTNLSDTYPWGLWILFDLVWIAVAAGAFALAGVIYVFQRKDLYGLGRSAVLIGLLSYSFVTVTLIADLGLPWHSLKPTLSGSRA